MHKRALVALIGCAALAGCGGSAHPKPTAASVCSADRKAAATLLGSSTQSKIVGSDPANIECVIDGKGLRLDVVAMATSLAWTEYDTATVHLEQAFGSGAVHVPGELPRPLPSVSGNAVWVPAQAEVIATNGTQYTGGNYVTVTVKRTSAGAAPEESVAAVVAHATLQSAPRGANPAPQS
jgi:membrane-bound inhibitor of C-type lysozyme